MVPAERTLADEHCCREAAEHSATLAETALAKEQHCSLSAEAALAEYDAQTMASWDAAAVKAAKHTTRLVVTALAELETAPKLRYGGPLPTHYSPPLTAAEVTKLDAAILDKQHHHETTAQEKELADGASKQHRNEANKQLCHKATTGEKALVNNACKQLCQWSAKCTAALAKLVLAVEQTTILTDSALPKPALAKDKQRQDKTLKNQCRADNKCVIVPVLPPNPVKAAICCLRVECTLLTAPLDAILAKIECNGIAHKARAPWTTTLPHPEAMLSTPPAL